MTQDKKQNIILIGMPGVGKSTVGVILAKMIGYGFIDSDLVIQETTGQFLQEIIKKDGISAFLTMENDINCGIHPSGAVISTGGSVIYGKDAMEHYQEIGTIVYLSLDEETLSSRLHNIKNRGVVFRQGQDFHGLYQERSPLYEKYADITIDTKGKTIEEVIEAVQTVII